MKIPRYDATGSMTTASPAAKQDPGVAGATGKAMSQMGEVLNQIGAKFVEIDIFSQKNEADVKYTQAMTDIQTRASQDPNIDKPEVMAKYQKELGDAYKEVLGGFSIPRARMEFQAQADKQTIASNAKLTQIHFQGKVAKANADAIFALDEIKNGYALAGDKESRELFIKKAHRIIDDGTAQGLWDAGKAAEKKIKLRGDWSRAAVNVLIAQDPDEAERQIVSGELPDISAEEKASFLKVIETARSAKERKAEKELEQAQTSKLLEISQQMSRGEIGAADIYKLVDTGELSPKLAQQAVQNLNQMYPTTNKKDLLAIYNMFQDPKETQKNIVGKIMASKLSDKDREDFIRVVESDFKSAIRAGERTPMTGTDYRRAVAQALNQAQKTAQLNDTWAARSWVGLVNSVSRGLIGEGDIPEAIQKVIKDGVTEKILQNNPTLASEPGDIVDNGYKFWAITELTKARMPLTQGNINALKEQLKQRDGI